MGDFGFDPGIILAGMRQGPSALETMQSLSQMMQQRQQGQMTLAALAQKQQQEQALRGIYQQNADHPEGLGQALLRGGFGPEAFGAQDQQYQMAKQLADIREAGMQKLRNRVAAAKTPEQYAEAIKIIPPARLGEFGLTPEFNPTTVSAFVAGGIPAEKQMAMQQTGAEFEETKRHHQAEEAKPAPSVIVPGVGGMFAVDPRNPTRPAVKVLDGEGNAVVKQTSGAGDSKEWKDFMGSVSTTRGRGNKTITTCKTASTRPSG
jgi:hypothetical protein